MSDRVFVSCCAAQRQGGEGSPEMLILTNVNVVNTRDGGVEEE